MARTTPASPNADRPPSGQGTGVSMEFQRECVEFFAEVVGALGVPRSYGQIYGLLFASIQPLSFTDIVEKLGISRGSASQGLQALKELGVVHLADVRDALLRPEGGDLKPETRKSGANGRSDAEAQPSSVARGGSRRDLYMPELRLRQLVGGLLREKVDPIVSGTAARMKTLRAYAVAAVDEDSRRFSLDRVKKLESWRRQTGLLLPVLKTILGPGRA